MLEQSDRISVSKMAEIHKLSRQTLIFYDKIDLFRPAFVEENGYRYYSYKQIPYLREICFLKSVGVKLEDIKAHIEHRSTDSALCLLRQQEEELQEQITTLTKMRHSVQKRISDYERADHHGDQVYQPYVTMLPERKVVFFPWGTEDVTRRVLHLTLMKAWTLAEQYDSLPPSGWGALVPRGSLQTGHILRGAGAYVNLNPGSPQAALPNVITIPAGEYACMYKTGMPYDGDSLQTLKQWVDESGYEITGDVVDECFLDTTFYTEELATDFCLLQIPIRRGDAPSDLKEEQTNDQPGETDCGYQRSQRSHSGRRASTRPARLRPL